MAFKMKKDTTSKPNTVVFTAIGSDDKVLFTKELDATTLSDEIRAKLILHGISQKVGDSYAGAGGDDVADPLAYTEEAIDETIAQLVAGDWKASGPGGPRVSDLAQAVAALNGQPVEAVAEELKAASDEARKKLRKKPAIAAKIAEIAAQKAVERAKRLAEAAAKEAAKEAEAA